MTEKIRSKTLRSLAIVFALTISMFSAPPVVSGAGTVVSPGTSVARELQSGHTSPECNTRASRQSRGLSVCWYLRHEVSRHDASFLPGSGFASFC